MSDIVELGAFKVNCHLKNRIGKGANGEVFRGENEYGTPIAAKMIPFEADDKEFVEHEMLTLIQVKRHPNILRMFYHQFTLHEGGNVLWIITELCDKGDLNKYCSLHQLTLHEKLSIFRDIASAIGHIHDHDIIHRDIKPANILLKTDGQRHVTKVADFGWARDTGLRTLATYCGTPVYMAPEVCGHRKKYTKAVDTFSLAVMMLQLFRAKPLQQLHDRELLKPVIGQTLWENKEGGIKGKDPIVWPATWKDDKSDCVRALQHLLRDMLQLEPDQRPDMDSVDTKMQNLTQLGQRPEQAGNKDEETKPEGACAAPTQPAAAVVKPPPPGEVRDLQRVKVHELGYDADVFIALCDTWVLTGNEDNVRLQLHQLSHDGLTLTNIATCTPPGECDYGCQKEVLPGGQVLVRDYHRDDTVTHILDAQLHTQREFSGDYGYLRGTIHDRCVVYVKEKQGGGYHLAVYDVKHRPVVTLQPPAGCKPWSVSLSVCGHPATQQIAVLDENNSSLDVFSKKGKHERRIELTYTARYYHGVTCDDGHLYMATEHPAAVTCHPWHAPDTHQTYTAQQLGLTQDDYLYAISATSTGLLTLAVGDDCYVQSIHVYQIKK